MPQVDSEFKYFDGNQNRLSTISITLFFYLFTFIFAGLTILTHVAQLLNISFISYSYVSIGFCLLAFLFWLNILKKRIAEVEIFDTHVLLLVFGIGLMGSILALISNRPSPDDYYYVPNAIYYIQNPGALMGFKIHYLFSGGVPIESQVWATSGAYEYIQAAISYFSKVDYLSLYYIVLPAITGLMIPLALFLAIAHFSKDTLSAAMGVIITIAAVLLLGETVKTFGNFSFDRIYQGKSILLSIGIPLIVAFTIDYFKRRSSLAWIVLFSVATSLTGMSSSTVFILPALSIILLIAYLFTANDYTKAFKLVICFFLSMGYVVAYALYILFIGKTNLGSDSPVNQGWPTTFLGHVNFLINPNVPMTPLVLILATILSVLFLSGKQKRFLAVWIIGSIGLFLNPIVSTILIKYVTSPNAYWRMFYIYPFPIAIGISVSAVFSRIIQWSIMKRFITVALVCVVMIGANLFFPSSVFRQDGFRVSWASYKLPLEPLKQAKQIIALAPRGVMLAPENISGIVVMLDAGFPQIHIREVPERAWLDNDRQPLEAELRIASSYYLEGWNDDFSSFEKLLAKYHESIRSIVIRGTIFNNNMDVHRLLNKYNFINQQTIDEYILVWK